jgi:Dolichyl-phosphate-mannose-protein mannosyltransferase
MNEKSSPPYLIPGIIFLVSILLHLSLMSKGPVTVDCLNLAINSLATINTQHLQYQFGSGYPLMVLLGTIFVSLGERIGITDPITAINLISVVFSSMAILVFYLLVQKICDALTAILASFILLLNPIFLDVSTYGINHAPAICFLLLGLLSLLRFQTEGKVPNLLLSALYFGFMGAVRLQDFILILPAVGYMFFAGLKTNTVQNNKNGVRYLLLFIFATILIIILFHLPYFTFKNTDYDIQAENYLKIGLTENFEGLFSKHLTHSLMYLIKGFSLVGIVCFGFGLYYAAKFNIRLLIFTVIWWIIPLSFYGNIITIAPRFFSIILPALIIPMSIFLARLLRLKKIQWKLLAVVSLLTIILQPFVSTQKTFIRRHYYALIPDFYRWVGKSTEPDAWIITCDDGLFISYYSKRKVINKPAVSFRHLPPEELIDFKKKLDDILNSKKPVYITNLTLSDYDHFREFWNLMWKNYHLTPVGQMPLELWYQTPYETFPSMYILAKVEKKN